MNQEQFEDILSDYHHHSTVLHDPGADLSPDDSGLWLELFSLVAKNTELAAMLLYLRGTGCRLVKNKQSYKIEPIVDPDGRKGWESVEHYNSEKWVLLAYRDELVKALGRLHQEKAVS